MPGTFDHTLVSKVQEANDIVDVISEHVSLKKKGREMVGLCPFHDDHRPSLNVNADKQIFKCFACGAGGDVLKFVQMRENLTFPQAIRRLAQRAGIKLKPAATTKTKSQQNEADPNQLAKLNAWAVEHFQNNLADKEKGDAARKYIAQRQITPESIKKWQLGLALSGDALIAAANSRSIPLKLLEQAGLVVMRTDGGGFTDKFVNRLMFPIADATGRIIGFGGRTLDETGAKYLNSPATALFDKSNALYGLYHARSHIASSGVAVVVEGYTDCIMAHQFGCTNVVASLGTSFTTGQARILRRYAKEAVLLFDSDAAGIEAANRALEVCLLHRIDIKLAHIPEGKDPCDFLLAAGRQQFEELISGARDVLEFKWARLKDRFGPDHTLADNKAAIDEFLQTVAAAMWAGNLSAIEKGLVVNRLSTIVPLDGKQINAELSKKIAALTRTGRRDSKDKKVPALDFGQGLTAAAQKEILEVLLNQPVLFELVKQKITPVAFDVPILARTADVLFETLNSNPNASLKHILAKAEDVSLGNSIVELAQSGAQKGNFETRLAGALNVIQRLQQRKKIDKDSTTKAQDRFLQDVREAATKQNPHSIGMV
jgi:DNA primase